MMVTFIAHLRSQDIYVHVYLDDLIRCPLAKKSSQDMQISIQHLSLRGFLLQKSQMTDSNSMKRNCELRLHSALTPEKVAKLKSATNLVIGLKSMELLFLTQLQGSNYNREMVSEGETFVSAATGNALLLMN